MMILLGPNASFNNPRKWSERFGLPSRHAIKLHHNCPEVGLLVRSSLCPRHLNMDFLLPLQPIFMPLSFD